MKPTPEVHWGGRVVEVRVRMSLPRSTKETHYASLRRLGLAAGRMVVEIFEDHGLTISEAEVVTDMINHRHRLVDWVRKPKVVRLKKTGT